MRPGDALVIERTANGWLVRADLPRDSCIVISEMRCFQHFDYDSQGVQSSEECLFGFLLKHFKRVEPQLPR